MLAFKDFYPKIDKPGNWLKSDKWQPLEACLGEANVWLSENKVEPINVETVVLPNVWSDHEEGPSDAELVTYTEFRSRWYQVVRVWYRKG